VSPCLLFENFEYQQEELHQVMILTVPPGDFEISVYVCNNQISGNNALRFFSNPTFKL
jgi:hypothetical protein